VQGPTFDDASTTGRLEIHISDMDMRGSGQCDGALKTSVWVPGYLVFFIITCLGKMPFDLFVISASENLCPLFSFLIGLVLANGIPAHK
jgi:hypothetical protein